MVIDFTKVNLKERPMLVLRNLDGTPIQVLGHAYNIEPEIYYNEMSSLTFDLPEHVDGVKTPGYDDVIGTRIVDLVGYGQFVLVDPKIESDGIREIKSCKAYSLEYELTYKKMSLEEGTYNFWNPFAREGTIIDIILSYLPSWSVGEIDDTLISRYRTFDVSYENIYNFIKSTLQQKYGCIFDFDTYNRKINVKAVSSYTAVSPVYISLENLASNITVEEDTENIFTVLDVNGADGVTIRSVNPLGTNKIYNLDYFMNTGHFSQPIIDKWNLWKESFAANQLIYYNLTTEQALKTAAILTEEHKLTEMKDAELAALETEQSVYIEYLASLSKNSTDYDEYSALLKSSTEKIKTKKAEITGQKTKVNTLKSEKDALTEKLIEINKAVAFDKFFSEDELKLLDRYFKEDAIEDSAFVYSEAETYTDDDLSSQISGVKFTFSDGDKEVRALEDGRRIFVMRGGTMTSGAVSAEVVRVSVELGIYGELVMSGYLQEGSIGDNKFSSGCISMTGTWSTHAISSKLSPSFTVNSAYLYFTKNTTEYERRAVEWDLYEYGSECLEKLAFPSYSFDVDAANFFALDEYLAFASKIALGNKLYLQLGENKTLQPILIGLQFNFDDLGTLKLHFGDTYSASKSSFELADLLEQSVSMGKTVDTSRFNYNSYINSGASSAVHDYMNNALDASKQAILSGTDMAISWDASGMKFRKWNANKTDYENEQIAIINNNIVFTDDGWQTAKMAIGKFTDKNLGESWGVVAPNIVGTLLAGENLVIDTKDGFFKVDSSGVHINSLKFLITHGDTSEKIEDYLDSREDAISQNFKNSIDEISKDIKSLEDGMVVTYYKESMPENPHVGDLWYVKGADYIDKEYDESGELVYEKTYCKGKLYRYNGSGWDTIEDADIVNAIEKANTAQATADGKIVSYYQKDLPSGHEGDLWYVTGENDVTYYDKTYGHGKLYRYTNGAWVLVEDGDIPAIKENISNAETAIAGISNRIANAIKENGYVNAEHMQGIIDAQRNQMKAAGGNFLIDKEGMWLMNTASKNTMTAAVWANSEGIMVGKGSASNDPGKTWGWETAIGPGGIVASAIAAGTLSGMSIVGGELKLGQIEGTQNYNFVVDKDGNVTANSGTFKGTVEGATFKTIDGTPMMTNDYKFDANYLSLKGIEIKNGNITTFAVNSDTGAVTINGKVTLGEGSVIDWNSGIADNGALQKAKDAEGAASDAATAAASAVQNASAALTAAGTAEEKAAAADELANALLKGHYGDKLTDKTKITGMYIYSPHIYSPNIYANKFTVVANDKSNTTGGFEINGSYKTVTGIKSGNIIGIYYETPTDDDGQIEIATVTFKSDIGAYAEWDFTRTSFYGYVDFSNATTDGLTSTAVFG